MTCHTGLVRRRPRRRRNHAQRGPEATASWPAGQRPAAGPEDITICHAWKKIRGKDPSEPQAAALSTALAQALTLR